MFGNFKWKVFSMNNKPKITFKKVGDNYISNEKISSIDPKYFMKELAKHIAHEKKVKEILGTQDEQ